MLTRECEDPAKGPGIAHLALSYLRQTFLRLSVVAIIVQRHTRETSEEIAVGWWYIQSVVEPWRARPCGDNTGPCSPCTRNAS